MSYGPRSQARVKLLSQHLEAENPLLVAVMQRFVKLDKVAINMGLMDKNDTYTTKIAWWPMISVLGTFSAGKSSFINDYIGADIQKTGNQAVDDKFTVITYSADNKTRTLPGIALDSDVRFPFYQMSEEIDKVVQGEGAKVDNYLQMKVVPSETLRGKIIIDSPGFDADAQRKSTLRITSRIIDISDLVLVFFDARHPEPGAMQDTLEHLVKGSQKRSDNNKFLFILNQIDTSARDDNLEEIVASWQKALVQAGLSAGQFFVLFNTAIATPVDNEAVWQRYVDKRTRDNDRIMERINAVDVERLYRIIGSLETRANDIEKKAVPQIKAALRKWRNIVLSVDAVLLLMLFLLIVWNAQALISIFASLNPIAILIAVTTVLGLFVTHRLLRSAVATWLARSLPKQSDSGNLAAAFKKSTRAWRMVFQQTPSGWGKRPMRQLEQVRNDVDSFIQKLNDNFSRPSGNKAASQPLSK